jgi:hypothetical protein
MEKNTGREFLGTRNRITSTMECGKMTNVMDSVKWHGSQNKESLRTKVTSRTMRSMVTAGTPGPILQFGTTVTGSTEWGADTAHWLTRTEVGMKALLRIIWGTAWALLPFQMEVTMLERGLKIWNMERASSRGQREVNLAVNGWTESRDKVFSLNRTALSGR